MIKLQLMLIYNTDFVTSRLFRRALIAGIIENGLCFFSPHIEQVQQIVITIIWCYIKLQSPTVEYFQFLLTQMSFIYVH